MVDEPGTSRSTLATAHEAQGPWSLHMSKRFWEGFAPSALATTGTSDEIRTVFLSDTDWQRVDTTITQEAGGTTHIVVTGQGDLDAATAQVCRFLSLDVDARSWPDVGARDPVIANAQQQLPGFRPCGFYSPYEAATWSVLSQRIQMRQAAAIKVNLTQQYGDDGAFPAPAVLLRLDLDLPGRKNEYLHAVAEAALEGRLSGAYLRGLAPDNAIKQLQEIKGLGPFSAELVQIRGANFPDVMPLHEKRLNAEIAHLYGTQRTATEVAESWRPFRSWAAVHLRALRENRADVVG